MKSKDSPSALAFTSPEKRRVMSELVAARNIIKNKFKRAYRNRITRERETKKLFKPVLSSLESFRGKKKKKKNGGEELEVGENDEADEPPSLPPSEDEASEAELEQRVEVSTPSTPKRGKQSTKKRILTFDTSMKKGDKKRIRVSKIYSPAPALLAPTLLPSARTTRAQQRILRSHIVDADKCTYEIVSDYQDIKHYSKPPTDHFPVNVKEVVKGTDKSNIFKVEWRRLPRYAQRKWLNHRRYIYDQYKRSREREVEDMLIDTPPTVRKLGTKRNLISNSPRKIRKKTRRNSREYEDMEAKTSEDELMGGAGMKPIDSDFIPYNINNRIIYEYFDDPNEICDRLRLLVSSRMAGNSNHMQEINSIVEELRELKCIH